MVGESLGALGRDGEMTSLVLEPSKQGELVMNLQHNHSVKAFMQEHSSPLRSLLKELWL